MLTSYINHYDIGYLYETGTQKQVRACVAGNFISLSHFEINNKKKNTVFITHAQRVLKYHRM